MSSITVLTPDWFTHNPPTGDLLNKIEAIEARLAQWPDPPTDGGPTTWMAQDFPTDANPGDFLIRS